MLDVGSAIFSMVIWLAFAVRIVEFQPSPMMSTGLPAESVSGGLTRVPGPMRIVSRDPGVLPPVALRASARLFVTWPTQPGGLLRQNVWADALAGMASQSSATTGMRRMTVRM